MNTDVKQRANVMMNGSQAGVEKIMLQKDPNDIPTIVIQPQSGWRLVDWKELVDYRDLFLFLVWRDIKVRYAQSAL